MNIHMAMCRIGVENWCIIPLNISSKSIKRIERVLIRKWRLNLNTLWLKKKEKRKKRKKRENRVVLSEDKVKKKKERPERLFGEWRLGKETYHDLREILKMKKSNWPLTLTWLEGQYEVNSWRKIFKNFKVKGSAAGREFQSTLELEKWLRKEKRIEVILLEKEKASNRWLKLLHLMWKGEQIRVESIWKVWKLWKASQDLRRDERKLVRAKLRKIFQDLTSSFFPKRITLRVQFSDLIDRRLVKKVVGDWLKGSELNQNLR
jgi:hypothetical protein